MKYVYLLGTCKSVFMCGDTEYKKSVRRDIKGRKLTPVEDIMEIWTRLYQDDQVKPLL